MFYTLLLLFITFSSQAIQDVANINIKTKMLTYSCMGSKQGNIFTVKATSTEYIILNKRCLDNKNNTKATSTEYIILLVK